MASMCVTALTQSLRPQNGIKRYLMERLAFDAAESRALTNRFMCTFTQNKDEEKLFSLWRIKPETQLHTHVYGVIRAPCSVICSTNLCFNILHSNIVINQTHTASVFWLYCNCFWNGGIIYQSTCTMPNGESHSRTNGNFKIRLIFIKMGNLNTAKMRKLQQAAVS